ncbi:MAG: hypothetical protein COB36_02250 [Alphaproteobacteria bacterium]|nr:MAG: hypothetical protein COB36_02250 [Alphaproteobacteria bacterium]
MQHFKHIPETDPENDYEYPWSIVEGRIKNNQDFWDYIDACLERKADSPIKYKNFKVKLCDYLVRILNQNPPKSAKDRSRKRKDELDTLLSMDKGVKAIRSRLNNSYLQHALHEIFIGDIKSKPRNKDIDEFLFFDDVLLKKEEIDDGLSTLLQAIDIAIGNVEGEKGTRSADPRTHNKEIKNSLALWLAHGLNYLGLKPSTTPNSDLENVFIGCCDALGLKLKGTGGEHIELACKELNSKKC